MAVVFRECLLVEDVPLPGGETAQEPEHVLDVTLVERVDLIVHLLEVRYPVTWHALPRGLIGAHQVAMETGEADDGEAAEREDQQITEED